MESEKMNGNITISTIRSNAGDDYISIELNDKNSGIRVVSINMSIQDFAKAAICNEAYIPCEYAAVKDTNNLGKKKVFERVTVELPKGCQFEQRKQIAYQLIKEKCSKEYGEDWTVRDYFGSQDSFHYNDGKEYATGLIYCYIENEE